MLEVPKAALPRWKTFTSPRDGYRMPARLYAPVEGGGRRAALLLLYLHGGGFTIGNIATHDMLCRELARLSGALVVSLEYRLAPEHRFPTASNDAWDALAWLAQRAATLGATPPTGGGATAPGHPGGSQRHPGARCWPAAGFAAAVYPGCAAHQDTPSHATYSRGLVLEEPPSAGSLGTMCKAGPSGRTGGLPPTRPDVEGVAPAWIGLAECDPLVDEGVDYADKLRASSVAVDLKSTVA